jgi:Flp pilus assembly protein TadG
MDTTNGSEKGATTILLAVVIVGLIGVAALAIDLGYGLVVKSELQNVSDTGTLAGTRELALIYKNLNNTCVSGSDDCYWGTHALNSSERAQIESKVNTFTQANKAGGKSISVSSGDMVYGKYSANTGQIEPTSPAYTGVMGVSVIAKRDASSNGVVPTVLAKVLGINNMSISARSGSSLSALGKLPAGGLGIPVGISKFWFTARNSPCGKRGDSQRYGIRLYPTGPQNGETLTNAQGCAGWHTYNDSPSNANKLGTILDGIRLGTYTSPATTANVTQFDFIGGVVSSQFNAMKQLFNAKKVNGVWETIVPVYESSDCSNPGGLITIVGFATAYIYNIIDQGGNKVIDATVSCNVVDIGEGGGTDYGTLVGRPGMIQ